MPKNVIYGLIDPRTGTLRYIGKSKQGMRRARSHSHPRCLGRDRSRKGAWIKSLRAAGMSPICEVLEEGVDDLELPMLEQFWIASVRITGAVLYNHTDGGDGCPGRPMNLRTREALRAANLGSKRNWGKCKSEETKHNMRSGAYRRTDNKSPVIITATDTMLPSIRQAAHALGIGNAALGNYLNGKRPWPNGSPLAQYGEDM